MGCRLLARWSHLPMYKYEHMYVHLQVLGKVERREWPSLLQACNPVW